MSHLRKLCTGFGFASVLLATLAAQGPIPLPDLNQISPINVGSKIGNDYANMGGFTYFSAYSFDNGNELWRTTGVPGSGVQLVVDIMPGDPGSSPKNLVAFGSHVYFQAHLVTNPAVGAELWRTDGTAAGTQLFLDLNQGDGDSSFEHGTVVGNKLFFAANDGTHGTELWVSDGTIQGTRLVKDIMPGMRSSEPGRLIAMAGKLYFAANGPDGAELWVSDGTASGTMGFDINPGPSSSGPDSLEVVGNKLFFAANDGKVGRELWVINGSGVGVRLVKDIRPGSNSQYSSPSDITAFGSKALFSADDGVHDRELWITDGTAAGTFMVTDIHPSSGGIYRPSFVTFAGKVLFTANDGVTGEELWVTDGTAMGTQLVADVEPGPNGSDPTARMSLANGLLFTATTGPHAADNEVWITDLTTTRRLKDINPRVFPSRATKFVTTPSGVTLFEADDGTHGAELWTTDGTTANTQLFADIFAPAPGATIGDSIVATFDAFGKTYFVAGSKSIFRPELWTTDGTAAGTVMLKDISTGFSGSHPYLNTVNGTIVFLGCTGSMGTELWSTDGTVGGTQLVIDLLPGPLSSRISDFCQLGNKLYFSAYGPSGKNGLYETDATAAGTRLVAHVKLALKHTNKSKIVTMGGKLYFPASDSRGYELWVSDGTAVGTTLLKDINTTSSSASGLRDDTVLTVFGDKILFAARDSNSDWEPWISDGTAAGTVMLKDIHPGASPSFPLHPVAWNDKAFFIAGNPVHGFELWITDGTANGTKMVKDIWPGSGTGVGNLHAHALLEQGMLFTGDDGAGDQQLWITDGTAAGTSLVKDIYSGHQSSLLTNLIATGSRRAYFSARSMTHGTELWVTDGTTAGTLRVTDIMPMRGSSNPGSLTLSGGMLYFRARHPLTGERLFKLDPGASIATVGHAYGSPAATPTLTSTDPVLGGMMTMSGTDAEGGVVILLLGLPTDAVVYAGSDLSFFVRNPSLLMTPAVNGSWSYSLPIPLIPQLKGISLAAQALIAPTTNTLGFSSTQGLHLTLGN